MRVLFTGGSGKAGKHAVAHLRAQGHRVLNLDLAATGEDALKVDLTDAGQVADALAALVGFDDLDAPAPPRFDAAVHFAAVPRILLVPDAETFRVNALSTYNVIDAALRAGVRKVVIASSETTYGICFSQGDVRPLYLPVDEDHPTVPPDSYAMSKVVNEATARSFHARSVNRGAPADIYALRINNVIEPDEYPTLVPRWRADPASRRRNVFAYIDARDLATCVERCLLTDGLGYQVFNVANDDSSVALPTREVIERFYPGVPLTRELGPHETFYANAKAKEMLGWQPRNGWRHGTW